METLQPNNQVITETPNDTSPRTVRTNWLLFAWSQISGATKILLLISISLSLIQISTTVIILIIGKHQQLSCERPLELYLVIFVIRVGLSLPLSVYQHLFMPRRRGGRQQQNRLRNNNNTLTSDTIPPSNTGTGTGTGTGTVTDTTPTTNTTTIEQTEQGNRQRQPSTIISGWVERVKSLLDLFAILWFIVGNYLVFSKSNCSQVAGPYFYTILTWILFGYTILLVPLLACASVVFCLPCVLVAMRTFNINISNVMVGGTKEEIAKIPVFKYKAPPPPTTTTTSNSDQIITPTVDETTTTTTTVIQQQDHHTMKRSNYFKRFLKITEKKQPQGNLPKTNKYLTIPRVEDAICTICLSEYEDDELVCKLWCDHHYHHSCVTEWLGLNSKCPLCKRDFRGKDYVTEDSDGEEQV